MHADIFPFPRHNWQRLESSSNFQVTSFHSLTCVTLCDIFGNLSLHASPPEILSEILVHLGAIRMNGKFREMCFVQDLFPQLMIFGTTRRSSNHKIPLWSTRKHLYLFSPSTTFCLMIPTLLSCNCAMMTLS